MVKLKTKKHIRVKINFLIVVDKITLYIDLIKRRSFYNVINSNTFY